MIPRVIAALLIAQGACAQGADKESIERAAKAAERCNHVPIEQVEDCLVEAAKSGGIDLTRETKIGRKK